ncbi:MAG: YbaB/EbfC family nucleoid-associated protein [Proteobacteria bacterium]|nr:YbaB/EbfC family nucleoid-associated protein [Pseudomonadota bacterium]
MMKDIGGLMKSMQAMQLKVAETQKKMETLTADGQSGGGLVKLSLQGENKLTDISIDKSLMVADDVEILEDLIKAAFEDARKKLDENRKGMEKDLMGGLNLPPGFKMPF